MAGLIAGWLLVTLIEFADEVAEALIGPQVAISTGAATAVLAAVGGGMITFSGFVFSFAILIVQFGSSAYSPRMVSYFLRRRSTQWILAVYLATIAYCFVGLISVGSQGREEYVPRITVTVSLFLLVLCLVGFIGLMYVTGSQIRVDFVLASLGRQARSRLARRIPADLHARQTPEQAAPSEPDELVQVDYAGRYGQVVAIDTGRLARIAHARGITLVLQVRVGDSASDGTPVARVDGHADQLGPTISRCLVVDDERSLIHDPLYALRLLVDIAIRALSPAVNDPTTAARALDEVEGVLRSAAHRPLGSIRLALHPGVLVMSTATWDELVDLALLEIAEFGVGQVQVTRRMIALLDDLIPDVPAERQDVLRRHRESLVLAVGRQPLSQRAMEVALRPDRQGLGGSG